MVLSAAIALALMASPAAADPTATRDAIERLDELLTLRVESGLLREDAVMPAILVSTEPRYEASADWFSTRVIEVLDGAFGEGGLRVCQACSVPRVAAEEGVLVYQSGPMGLDEVVRLDDQTRGDAPPARSAIWVEEHGNGLAIRIIDLATGRVLLAQNIDPDLIEYSNSRRTYAMAEELERRARGDSLTQAFVDIAVVPGQHISLDWTDQWGPRNERLSGVTLSVLDPIVGVGASHYRATRLFNTTVGAKVLMSLPTAVVNAVDAGGAAGDVIDPLLTGVGVVRVPFGRSNYGGVVTLSTNGEFALGISLLNVTFLPVLP